jgi:hypothetical protein
MSRKSARIAAHEKQAGRGICSLCEQPILYGPDVRFELAAGRHRRCLCAEVHQELVKTQSFGLMLKAITLLGRSLPSARDTIVPLAGEFNDRRMPRDCLAFVDRALDIVVQEQMPNDQKSALAAQLADIKGQIQRLIHGDSS